MIEEIRTKVQSLYETKELLGFSIMNDEGDVVHNESFLCDEAVVTSTEVFVKCRDSMLRSKRKLNRFVVELDDVILLYRLIPAGHIVFTLDSDCDLDGAAKILMTA